MAGEIDKQNQRKCKDLLHKQDDLGMIGCAIYVQCQQMVYHGRIIAALNFDNPPAANVFGKVQSKRIALT